MTDRLGLTLLTGSVLYIGVSIGLLKKRVLSLKYALLWLLTGVFLLLLTVNPKILYTVSAWIGIEMPVNGLFLFMIAFLFMIVLSITVIVSRQSERIKILTQKVALMEKRLRDIEKRETDENRNYHISENE